MAAPSYITGAFGSVSGGSSLPIVMPSGIQANDLLLVVTQQTFTSDSVTAATGWTQLGSALGNRKIQAFYKIAAGTESGTTVSFGESGSGSAAAQLLVYRGALVAAPVIVDGTYVTTQSVAAPSLSPSLDDTMLVCFWGGRSGTSAGSWSFSLPGDMTSRFDQASPGGNTRIAGAEKALTDTSATGTKTATSSYASGGWELAAKTIAVAPLVPVIAGTGSAAGTGSLALTAPDAPGYRTSVLATPGLQSYWRLEEGSGTFLDSKGSVNSVSTTGTITRSYGGAVDGGNGIKLATASTQISFGDVYDLTGTAQPFTIEGWVKRDSAQTDGGWLITKWPGFFDPGYGVLLAGSTGSLSGTPGYGIEFNRQNTTGGWDTIGSAAIPADVWTHFAAVYGGAGDMRLYVNGLLASSYPAAGGTLPNTTSNLRIGESGGGAPIAGIDDIAIYNVALSSATVQEHYSWANGNGGVQRPPITGIAPASAVGTPTVSGGTATFTPGIASESAVGTPTIIGAGMVQAVRVSVYISHTFDGDVQVTLLNPTAQSAYIIDGVGDDGDDFGTGPLDAQRTVLDDAASTKLEDGVAPFVGEFHPPYDESFHAFLGRDPNGTWTLRIADLAGADTGTLHEASLFITVDGVETRFDYTGADVPIPDDDEDGVEITFDVAIEGAPLVVQPLSIVPTTNAFGLVTVVGGAGEGGGVGGGVGGEGEGVGGFGEYEPTAIPAIGLVPSRRAAPGYFRIKLTSLHRPAESALTGGVQTPAHTLAHLTDHYEAKVEIPINDQRTASVKVPMTDPVCQHIRPYSTLLHVVYVTPTSSWLVFWGIVVQPEWNSEEDMVTINAVDMSLRLQHHYVRRGDRALNPSNDTVLPNPWNPERNIPFSFSTGHIPLTWQGMDMLIEAAQNIDTQIARGVPPLGIVAGSIGSDFVTPGTGETMEVQRGDEVWEQMIAMISNYGTFDFELEPRDDLGFGIYAAINYYANQGETDEKRVVFNDGFGLDNCLVSYKPGGNLITHAQVLSAGNERRESYASLESSLDYGVYVYWDSTDEPKNKVGRLRKKARALVNAYSGPPDNFTVAINRDAPMYYLDNFAVGDRFLTKVRRGQLVKDLIGDVRRVTLEQIDDAGNVAVAIDSVVHIDSPDVTEET